MSKWLNKDLFDDYLKEKEQEKTEPQYSGKNFAAIWKSLQKGNTDTPLVYEGRFLSDPNGKFTKKFFYHMYQKESGEWVFVLCQKTFKFDNWCPFCSVTQKLYKGTTSDKKEAYKYKRKQKHVSNFYVIDDPRDAQIQDESKKSANKVLLYEFPDKVESKLSQELFDKKNGRGFYIFDPGKDGYNFIIKVKSTKKDAKGETYPDYSDSVFTREPSALGTEEEITKIMESTYSLDEHLENQKMNNDVVIKLLKEEMLWDLIESEWKINIEGVNKNEKEDDIPDFKVSNSLKDIDKNVETDKENKEDESSQEKNINNNEDISDDDLLKELENM